MTPFEIIILVLIYCFCYGYANNLMHMKNENFEDGVLRVIWSFIVAIYVPLIIGYNVANKLNE